jgi:hypothetical protein
MEGAGTLQARSRLFGSITSLCREVQRIELQGSLLRGRDMAHTPVGKSVDLCIQMQ